MHEEDLSEVSGRREEDHQEIYLDLSSSNRFFRLVRRAVCCSLGLECLTVSRILQLIKVKYIAKSEVHCCRAGLVKVCRAELRRPHVFFDVRFKGTLKSPLEAFPPPPDEGLKP